MRLVRECGGDGGVRAKRIHALGFHEAVLISS